MGPVIFVVVALVAAVAMFIVGTGGEFSKKVLEARNRVENTNTALLSTNLDGQMVEDARKQITRPLPAARELKATPAVISARGFTPAYVVEVTVADQAAGSTTPEGTENGEEKPPEVEVPKTEVLVAPDEIAVAVRTDAPAIHVMWSHGVAGENQKPAADQGFMVWRAPAVEPKKWLLLTTDGPVTGHGFADLTANPGVAYFYAVAASVPERQILNAVDIARTTVVGAPPKRYSITAMLETKEPAALSHVDMVTWHKVAVTTNRETRTEELKAVLSRWVGNPNLLGTETAWYRLTIEVSGIAMGQPIGGKYSAPQLTAGDFGNGQKGELTVEQFDGGKLDKITDANARRKAIPTAGVDFSTGATFLGARSIPAANENPSKPIGESPANPYEPAPPAPPPPPPAPEEGETPSGTPSETPTENPSETPPGSDGDKGQDPKKPEGR